MGQRFKYYHESQWITEGSVWRPPDTITLRDEAGVVIPSTQVVTVLMTIYDINTNSIINNVEQTDIKNLRSCSISTQGILIITLLSDDTQILNEANTYELRRILVEYTWPMTPTKSDAIEISCIIRNLERRPFVAP